MVVSLLQTASAGCAFKPAFFSVVSVCGKSATAQHLLFVSKWEVKIRRNEVRITAYYFFAQEYITTEKLEIEDAS